MHITVINASPCGSVHSNTKMIVDSFAKSVAECGHDIQVYSLSERKQWKEALESIHTNENIVFAIPVYVGIAPSLFKEFIEQLNSFLPAQVRPLKRISFIVQSAFPETTQRACCEKYLQYLTQELNCRFSGILSHCVFYSFIENGTFENLMAAYSYFGKKYTDNDCTFFFSEAGDFNGAEILTERQAKLFVRGFNFLCRMNAQENGCTRDLHDSPYENLNQ
ncbi:MAG: NAD(P)H-dependent oxidoreductase [Clostridia bacterium]|nr:NAD(P)H-dependent oxidoreductase [Clostridia bacterium]